jgi:hypothetical protein
MKGFLCEVMFSYICSACVRALGAGVLACARACVRACVRAYECVRILCTNAP